MDNNTYPTPEELEKLIEKAKKDLQETLDKMTPEERREAELRAQKMIAEDQARMQQLIDDAAAILGKKDQKDEPKKAQDLCPHCGAPISGGNFCEYCGSPLR